MVISIFQLGSNSFLKQNSRYKKRNISSFAFKSSDFTQNSFSNQKNEILHFCALLKNALIQSIFFWKILNSYYGKFPEKMQLFTKKNELTAFS